MEVKDPAAKTAKAKPAGADDVKMELGISQTQFQEILAASSMTAGSVAAQAAHHAAAKYLEEHIPTAANAAVAEALARKGKSSALKTYGAQAAVSAGVFALGTAAMYGVNQFRNRDNRGGHRGVGSNQYQDQPATS